MGQITLKNKEILEIYQTLANINGAKNTDFNYDKALNKVALERKAKPLSETQAQMYSHIAKYNEEHGVLSKKYADKDENGQPKIKEKRGNITFWDISPKNQAKLEAELKNLREKKYKKEFAAFEKAAKAFEKILNQTQTVNLVKFKRKYLPPDLDDSIEVLIKIIE